MVDAPLSSPPKGYAAQHLWLNDLHRRLHHRTYVQNDPLGFVYPYGEPADQEIVALIAALLAYGNVKAIGGGVRNALGRMTSSPHEYLLNASPTRIGRDFHDFRYRVTSGAQMALLLRGVRAMLLEHGSLHAGFARHLRPDHPNVLPATGLWIDELAAGAAESGGDGTFAHLLPHPSRGSACKRLMLYLRWMVRRDDVDIGVWSNVPPALLIAPVDTHLFAMARRLRWTRRKQANLATAMEITAALRRFDAEDPLRYDFALTRPGIMRIQMQGRGRC